MKKLISILCTAAMLMAAAVLPAAAEEKVETEAVISSSAIAVTTSNSAIDGAIGVVYDNVNGVERPVIKVNFTSSTSDFKVQTDLSTQLNPFSVGTYRLTATYRCTANPGQGRMGIRRGTYSGTTSGNYPDNSPQQMIKQADEYVTTTMDFTVGDSYKNEKQFAGIRFGNGDSGECYIAEFKLQQILDGGELGDNILPELYTERIAGTIDSGWSLTNSGDSMNLTYATIDGVEKPVLEWDKEAAKSSNLRYTFAGPIEVNNYRISVTYYAPGNPGNGKVGIRRDSNGGWPSNTTTGIIVKNTGYSTVTRDVTVTADNATVDYQYLNIACESGDAQPVYISEVRLQAINSDGTLGINLIPNGDFIKRTVVEPEEPEVKKLEMAALENAVEYNEDNTKFSKGFVTEEAFSAAEYKTLVFGITKDNAETYKACDMPTTISGSGSIMLGVQLQDIPAEYAPEDIKLYLTDKVVD